MRTLILLAGLLWAAMACGENERLRELKLKNGKTYTAVTITKKAADGIAIMHESGTARIPFEQLPDDLVEKLGGFDAEAAVAARENAQRTENRHFEEAEKAEAKKKERAKNAEILMPAIIQVVQAFPDGALCKVAWITKETQHETSKDSFGREVTIPRRVVAVPVFDEAWIYVHEIHAVDKDRAAVMLIPTGESHSYTTTVGARATVRSYKTGSKLLPAKIQPREHYE